MPDMRQRSTDYRVEGLSPWTLRSKHLGLNSSSAAQLRHDPLWLSVSSSVQWKQWENCLPYSQHQLSLAIQRPLIPHRAAGRGAESLCSCLPGCRPVAVLAATNSGQSPSVTQTPQRESVNEASCKSQLTTLNRAPCATFRSNKARPCRLTHDATPSPRSETLERRCLWGSCSETRVLTASINQELTRLHTAVIPPSVSPST